MNTDIQLDLYSVYYHKDKDQIFYVGMGSANRPFVKSGRTSMWRKYVREMKGRPYSIEIVKQFNLKKDACAFEKAEIERLRPTANKVYNYSDLKPCGHRLESQHFNKIRRVGRKYRCTDAEALRLIIDKHLE